MDNAGVLQLGIVLHVPNDAADRGDVRELGERVKVLMDSASALVYG